jgi:mannose-6-phosphate isomerase-like protein (cupin superfamily)
MTPQPIAATARGCALSLNDIAPTRSDGDNGGGGAAVWRTLGPDTGMAGLEQRVLELSPGATLDGDTGAAEEALFVLGGRGCLRRGDAVDPLEGECGVRLPPGERYRLQATGEEPLRVVAVAIPDPAPAPAGGEPAQSAVVRRLADQQAGAATSDRQFRVVGDPASGLRSATHFVGYIPTVRSPDHFHTYDEVIYVIDGEGVLHLETGRSPVAGGSCIQLPARIVHCLENTGEEVMRIVAVFRPAGSPAAAYYPDGTPAFAGAPPLTV